MTLTVESDGALGFSFSNRMLASLLYTPLLVPGRSESVLNTPGLASASFEVTIPPLDGGLLPIPSEEIETLRRSDAAGAVEGRSSLTVPPLALLAVLVVMTWQADGGRKRGSKLSGVAELGRHPRADADGRDAAATALAGLIRRPDNW